MRFAAHVEVWLRPGIADPEGATIERAIGALGVPGISQVAAGRAFHFVLEAPDLETARARAGDLAHRLLANPVIHDSTVAVEPAPAAAGKEVPAEPGTGGAQGPG